MERLPLFQPHYAGAGNPMRFPTRRLVDPVATCESPLPAGLRDFESGDRTRRALQTTSTLACAAPTCFWTVWTPPRRLALTPSTAERYPPGWCKTETGRARDGRLGCSMRERMDTRSFRRRKVIEIGVPQLPGVHRSRRTWGAVRFNRYSQILDCPMCGIPALEVVRDGRKVSRVRPEKHP